MELMKALHVKKRLTLFITAVVLIWLIGAFLIIPNLTLLWNTFLPNGAFTIEPLEKLLASERAMNSLKNSFILAFTLVITVNVVGIFLVLVSEYFDIKGAKVLRLGYFTTLIYGGVVLVSGYKFLYGTTGFITQLLLSFSPNLNPDWFTGYLAVVIVMTFAATSNHILFLSNAIRTIDYQTIEAARNMGASTWTILTRVVLPVLKPVIFSLSILIFLGGLGAMAAPLMLGGENFQTINPMILSFAKNMGSQDIAALLALILGIATMIMLYFTTKLEKKGNYISVSKVKTELKKQKIKNPAANAAVHIFAYVLFLIYVTPILLIVVFSFTDTYSITTGTLSWDRFTLEHYSRILTDFSAYQPFLVSTVYSFLAAVLVVLLVLFAARLIHKYNNKLTALLEYTFHIPWLLPSTLIALGLIITFGQPQVFVGNKVLTGTLGLLLIAYVIEKIPFTLRIIKASFYSIDPSLEDASKNLGAKPLYSFIKIILPTILPSVLAILALNFNSQLTDYDLTVFLYHPLYQPLGVVIQNSMSPTASVDSKAITLVYTVLVMVISAAVIYFVYGRGEQKLGK